MVRTGIVLVQKMNTVIHVIIHKYINSPEKITYKIINASYDLSVVKTASRWSIVLNLRKFFRKIYHYTWSLWIGTIGSNGIAAGSRSLLLSYKTTKIIKA